MNNFKTVLVKDIAEKIQYGYTGKSIDKGSYRYLRITDIQNNKVDWESVPFSDIEGEEQMEKYKLKTNDIVFARTGATVGKSFLIEKVEDSVFASYLIRIVPKQRVFPKFLQYFFQSDDYWVQIRGHEVGAAQPNVNGKKLGKLKIPLPPLPEQRRIVSKLDALFAEIDASLAVIDQNIKQAEALKLSVLGEEINEQNFKKVPYLKYIKERKEKLKPEPKTTYNIIGLENIESYSGKLVDFRPLKGEESRSNKAVFKKGDILYSKLRPYLNKVLIADFDGIATTEIIPFIADSEKFINMFVGYFLRSESIVQQINLSCSGARMPRTKKSFWKTLEIPIPSIKTQQKIVQKLDALFADINGLVKDYTQKRANLEALKSSLLDRAFRGEL